MSQPACSHDVCWAWDQFWQILTMSTRAHPNEHRLRIVADLFFSLQIGSPWNNLSPVCHCRPNQEIPLPRDTSSLWNVPYPQLRTSRPVVSSVCRELAGIEHFFWLEVQLQKPGAALEKRHQQQLGVYMLAMYEKTMNQRGLRVSRPKKSLVQQYIISWWKALCSLVYFCSLSSQVQSILLSNPQSPVSHVYSIYNTCNKLRAT